MVSDLVLGDVAREDLISLGHRGEVIEDLAGTAVVDRLQRICCISREEKVALPHSPTRGGSPI